MLLVLATLLLSKTVTRLPHGCDFFCCPLFSPPRKHTRLHSKCSTTTQPQHQAQTPMAVGRNGGRSMVRHMDTGAPMGYSFPFEATVTYVKDSWCQPACMCLTQAVSSGDLGRVMTPLHSVDCFLHFLPSHRFLPSLPWLIATMGTVFLGRSTLR